MEITEIRVKLVERSSERLRAFCSITLDGDFVIRDLKVIGGTNGAFVAMPSRKLADRCSRCGCKNHLRARFCNECGAKLNENRAPKDTQGRAKLHADVAHPINAACRERIQNAVIEAYQAEAEKSKEPGYKPPKYDDFDDDDVSYYEEESPTAPEAEAVTAPVGETPSEEPPDDSGQARGRGRGRGRRRGGRDNQRTREQESQPERSEPRDKHDFSEYDSLIADLKREAAGRRERRGEGRRSWDQPEPDDLEPAPPEDSEPKEQFEPADVSDEGAEELQAPAAEPFEPQRRNEESMEPASSRVTSPTPEPQEEADDEESGFGAGL
jgi:stage V sporulation protein G